MMVATMVTRPQKARVCDLCKGLCHDPRAPKRVLKNGEVMRIVRPCPRCEGSGVPVPAGDRDFARSF